MGPAQSQWPNYEEKPQVQAESNHSINATMQVRSNSFNRRKNEKETASFPLPDCWRHFWRVVNSIISELLRKNYTTGGNNCTFAKIGLGSETLLSPRPEFMLLCSADLLSGMF